MKEDLKNNLKKIKKNESGFTGMDIAIAIAILLLFTGLIVTISHNIYVSTVTITKRSTVNSYIVDIFEYVEKEQYDNVNTNNLVNYFNNNIKYSPNIVKAAGLTAGGNLTTAINTPDKIGIRVEKYSDLQPTKYTRDVIKKITVSVKYTVGNKEQSIEMTRIKKK